MLAPRMDFLDIYAKDPVDFVVGAIILGANLKK
jgi:hypothetical protein